MDYAAARPSNVDDTDEFAEERGSPRFTLLIRAAKLVCSHGDFICVIRDVSSTGVSLRLFHDLPECENVKLVLQSGQSYDMRCVWSRVREAGFEFENLVDVDKLVCEAGKFPKRPVRLSIEFPVTICSGLTRHHATVKNISQQGANIECDTLFAIDQTILLEGKVLREVRSKVRWRKAQEYGVVFDDTFSLADLARLAAHLQCPALLADKPQARS